MLFDLTANSNSRKLMTLNPDLPKDVEMTIIKGNTTSATFTVEIAEHGKPAEYTYQWYLNGVAIEGATNPSYTMSGISNSVSHSIHCNVTNRKGTVSSRTATLKVIQTYTPVLNGSYPANATVTLGNSVTSKVEISTAGNPASYTYQWYKNGSAVSGATGSSYTFTPSGLGTTSIYCKVKNDAGSVNSRTATITVITGYFFNNGVINTSLTGGLSAVAQQHSSSTWPKYLEVTNGSNYISLLHIGAGTEGQNRSGAYYVNNAINLTNVRTISINVSLHDGSTYWSDAYLFVTNSKETQTVNYVAKVSIETVGNHVLDVSGLSGNYYIGIMLTGKQSCRVNFTEWKISS